MSQTDPRAGARNEMNERERNARRICNELVVLGGAERESFILQAQADAERRGMERAAKVVEEMYLKPERIWDADTLDGAINAIRAQAQADKEGT